MTSTAPVVTIVIVSHDARADLERCLESLVRHPPEATHEIVVVDNASSDGSADLVRDRWPAIRVIAPGRNLGFAAANNLAITSTSSELVLLLNGDTVVPAGAVDALIAALRTNPDVAIVGPRLVDASGRTEVSTGAMLSPWVELGRKLQQAIPDRWRRLTAWTERRLAREHRPDWVTGACLLVRRADAEAAGLLDERYFLYNEDVDFCAAVRRLGRGVLFTPAAEVVHLRGRSAATAPEAAARAYRRSQLAFYQKHHPRWVPVLRLYLRLSGRADLL